MSSKNNTNDSNQKFPLNVYNETAELKTVLLHKPCEELDNLTPEYMQRLLFDDIPDSVGAAAEYDEFIKVFEKKGIETLYVENLLAEVLETPEIKERFLKEYLKESAGNSQQKETLYEILIDYEPLDLVMRLIKGMRKEELSGKKADILKDITEPEYPLCLDPLPNLYFTRDPFAIIGHGVSINKMCTEARTRESLLGDYIFKYHETYKNVPKYYSRDLPGCLEGGDILVLSPKVVAVGISERTGKDAAQILASKLFAEETGFEHVLGFKIPSKRAFMHLDTVFTQIDKDLFVVHPEIEGELVVHDFDINNAEDKDKDIMSFPKVKEVRGSLEEILENYLEVDKIRIVRCGGKSILDAQREQWNDGSNVLAIAPNEIIVYDRNRITNDILEDMGVKLHKIPSSELSRGRGGPRCMSMPFIRA